MKNMIEEFGQNAGKVWRTINSQGPLTDTTLMKATRLDGKKFNAAVGWLARENKICKNNNIYAIGETNLTSKIGEDAGKVWQVLQSWGDIDITSITKLANIDEKDAYSALGWLAREDKIHAKREKTKNHKLTFGLK